MGRQQLLFRGLVVAGAGAIAAGVARRAASRRSIDFYDLALTRSEPKQWGAGYGGVPIVFHKTQSIEAFFPADIGALRGALPTPDLHPVTLPGGRGIVFVGAIQYEEITASGVDGCAALPYGEVMIAIPVSRRRAPPFLPLVAPPGAPIEAGGFVLHLPVTTRVARDVGRLGWGFPKFVADMTFDDSIRERGVALSEGGHDILRFVARPGGRPTVARESNLLYSVLGSDLLESRLPSLGIRRLRWGRRGGTLELGDHRVADELRELGIGSEPWLTAEYSAQRVAMTTGKRIGTARPYLGYIGEDRDLGTFVIRYPNASPIDRYAPFADTAGPSRAVAAGAGPVEKTTPKLEVREPIEA